MKAVSAILTKHSIYFSVLEKKRRKKLPLFHILYILLTLLDLTWVIKSFDALMFYYRKNFVCFRTGNNNKPIHIAWSICIWKQKQNKGKQTKATHETNKKTPQTKIQQNQPNKSNPTNKKYPDSDCLTLKSKGLWGVTERFIFFRQ